MTEKTFIRKNIGLGVILLVAGFLRFFGLMHDYPYFFNPDERNMANAIVQFKLPAQITQIPSCIISEFSPHTSSLTTNNLQPTTNCSLNPHFFAYGQFPLYLAFISDQLTKPFLSLPNLQPTTLNVQRTTSFPSAIFWLRFYSALSSTFIVLFVYLIVKFLIPKSKFQILSALIAAFSPGLIQSAHFGTTESLLAFFFLASIYFSLKLFESMKERVPYSKFIILNSLVVGLALGSKLTGFFFLVPPGLVIGLQILQVIFQKKKKADVLHFSRSIITLTRLCCIGILIVAGSILIGIISSPYNLVEPQNFKSAVFGYEKDVAMGKYEAFYTRQFANTTPILFQVQNIFPYVLGWPVFVLGTIGFILIIISLLHFVFRLILQRIRYYVLRIKLKKITIDIRNTYYVILTTSFVVYFVPNAFLFAKWSRFMTPILPFFAIFTGYFIYQVSIFIISHSERGVRRAEESSNYRSLEDPSTSLRMTRKLLYWLLVIGSTLPGLMFMSIYFNPDSRVTATNWILENIPGNAYILSETANVVDIPLYYPLNTDKHYTVVSFDLYHTDESPLLYTQLINHLAQADYIFIPSRRVFKNYPRLQIQYPKVTKYYQLLFSGSLGFEQVAQISSFPALGPFQFSDENAEETWTVFDHPVIRIYKKIHPYTMEEYDMLLKKNIL
jgi:hypothetical protein